MKWLFLLWFNLAIGLSACAISPQAAQPLAQSPISTPTASVMTSPISASAHAAMHRTKVYTISCAPCHESTERIISIPAEYSGLTNPISDDEVSRNRGLDIYAAYCISCHADKGMGHGPAEVAIGPSPSAIAHTSSFLRDDYLFWRINEGGLMRPFNSMMLPYKHVLNKQAIWDVINYTRALGRGQVLSPSEKRDIYWSNVLAQAVGKQLFNWDKADRFEYIRFHLDTYLAAHMRGPFTPAMTGDLSPMLGDLVKSNKITQVEADAFTDVRHKLIETKMIP